MMPRATWDVEIVAFVAEHNFRAHLRGLRKRGFTDEEIINIASKAGLKVKAGILTVKQKNLKLPRQKFHILPEFLNSVRHVHPFTWDASLSTRDLYEAHCSVSVQVPNPSDLPTASTEARLSGSLTLGVVLLSVFALRSFFSHCFHRGKVSFSSG